jgi:hypothetical protein
MLGKVLCTHVDLFNRLDDGVAKRWNALLPVEQIGNYLDELFLSSKQGNQSRGVLPWIYKMLMRVRLPP